MESIAYELNHMVTYDTDDEYRTEMGRVFRQIPLTVPYGPAPPCDNEPMSYPRRCEVEIDFDLIEPIVCEIASATRSNVLMHRLYKKAAGRLLSEDVVRGCILMFSYTAFDLFHRCLQTFVHDPDNWTDQNANYKELMRRMSKPTR